MKELFDKKSDMLKALEEHMKKVDAIHKLPEYQEYLKYKEVSDDFSKYIDNQKRSKTYDFIRELMEDDESKDLVKHWLERINKLEKRLSDIQWKKGYTFCSSNVMDHVFAVFEEYGDKVDVNSMFGSNAYQINEYTMEIYHGQGEYGYSITVPNRIF